MLKINNLSYKFSNKEVLSDINLNIEDGSFFALMGSNGSGKSTLLRCIDNLLPIPSNTIFIDNQDITTISNRFRATKIAYVAQQSYLDVDFSAFEMVLMGRNPYQSHLQNESQEDLDIVEQCMKDTNTWHLKSSSLFQMSGGERQRVMIARALAQQTPILLLDEPLSNLDIAHQFDILNILTRINKEQNKTIILIIHDLNLALRHCPKLLLLNDKKLIFNGNTHEGLNPQNIKKVFGVYASIQNIDNKPFIVAGKGIETF